MQCISPAAAAAAAPDHFGAIIVNYGLHFGGSFIHFVSRTDERASRLLRRSENAQQRASSTRNAITGTPVVVALWGETVAAAVSGKRH